MNKQGIARTGRREGFVLAAIFLSFFLGGIAAKSFGEYIGRNSARKFQMEDGTKVIRTYYSASPDRILVRQGDSVYIDYRNYLDNQKLEGYDRQIKEAEIKKLVGW